MRRIVITGIGTVNPLGLSVEEYWSNLAKGVSGIRIIDRFDSSTFSSRIAGLIPEFDHLPYFKDQKMARRLDRAIIYGVVAGNQALKDSGLAEANIPLSALVCIWVVAWAVWVLLKRTPRSWSNAVTSVCLRSSFR